MPTRPRSGWPAPAGAPRRSNSLSISVPSVAFTDERLANGLRLIVAEDHLAPVVAINVWYGVGS
jgi:zinc protease